jgi:23S rRNA (uracil1939-C5)-methyltransferase
MADLKLGTRLTLRVDRLSLGGDAIGHADGAVVFVPYGAPGDTLEVELIDVRKNFARARLVRVVEASPVREEAPCPYHFQPSNPRKLSCGGCSWQHMNYEFQLDAKRQLVEETLERIGGVQDLEVKDTLGMKDPWRYRNKVQQPVGWDGRRVISGFYAVGSHDIVPIEDCLVQPELSVKILNRARSLVEQFHLRPYDAERHSGWLRHLWIRTTSDGKALLVLITRTEDFPRKADFVGILTREFPALIGIHQNINPGRTNVILGREWQAGWGEEFLEERLGPLRFRLSPGSFFQINTPQTEVLYNVVKEYAGRGGGTLIDLFCGVGGIALWLASSFQRVIGVDEIRNAVGDAERNAALNGLKNTRFIASQAEQFISRNRDFSFSREALTVVLDPPRAGCDPRVLDALGRLRPSNIIYVSCDPGTLARDIAVLQKSGFKPLSAQPVDLFPQTPHIETVVHLKHLSR